MKYSLLALAAAAAVAAQNSTDSVLIPSNITDSCTSFLTELNADATLSECVTPLINATASFSPTAVAATNLTEDSINYTLASVCKTNTGCSDTTIRTWLSRFYSQCSAELTSSDGYNSDVRELYDILYVVNPLKGAVCSVDSSNQEYCVNEIVASESTDSSSASNSTSNSTALYANFAASDSVLSPIQLAASNLYIEVSASASSLKKRVLSTLSSRAAQSVNMATIITPNATTYKSTNLPFLFLQPTLSSSALCTPCTREVMVSYIKWETQVPYALGLSKSPILGGQSALWSAINSTCGTAFVNAIKSQVGTSLSSNSSSSGAESMMAVQGMAGMTALVGATFAAGIVAIFV
ncbi:hypothetical protein L198_01314 [Cryptococcus wingfieldii CBS 7118]|uniref:DUF7729 domain-containing protein n=1 Tax=Cryptococcus wingfieldii CBS 7118 TaxID=1295528 RepID=A0A1E3JYV6_9TREE|nr:hypothetical protein L198_01314 [Cryptococcus wingfieldii CBS 7118]ODO06084.1 hypothetical protein L198_01314 [Cryptococcus wingfieldii CBS 7118]